MGVLEILENSMLILVISNKSRISVIMTLFMTSQCKNRLGNDVITPNINSAGIHLLYYHSIIFIFRQIDKDNFAVRGPSSLHGTSGSVVFMQQPKGCWFKFWTEQLKFYVSFWTWPYACHCSFTMITEAYLRRMEQLTYIGCFHWNLDFYRFQYGWELLSVFWCTE